MYTRFVIVLGLLGTGAFAFDQTPDVLKGHKDLVYSVAFSPDGKMLATGSFDKTVKLWEFPSGKLLHTLEGHKDSIYCVAFSPDGKYLASGSQDNTIRLWNPKDGKFIRELKGHTKIVDSVVFSPDSKLLASCSSDKSVRLWNPDDGKEVKKLGEHKDSVYCVVFSPDGKYLASASNYLSTPKDDVTIKIWDVKGQKEHKSVQPDKLMAGKVEKDKDGKVLKSNEATLEVAFSKDSTKLYTGGNDKYLRVWNVAEGKELKTLGPIKQYIYGIAVSKDGKKVATAGYGGDIRVWDIDAGKEVFKTELKKSVKDKKINEITYCIAFTPDGTALVTGHESGGIVRITKIGPDKK